MVGGRPQERLYPAATTAIPPGWCAGGFFGVGGRPALTLTPSCAAMSHGRGWTVESSRPCDAAKRDGRALWRVDWRVSRGYCHFWLKQRGRVAWLEPTRR